MILTEDWVRNKLRYWCILHLSINILACIALVALIQTADYYLNFLYIPVGLVLFLIITDFCKLGGLNSRNICIITYWQVVFTVYIGLLCIGVIIGIVVAITALLHDVS